MIFLEPKYDPRRETFLYWNGSKWVEIGGGGSGGVTVHNDLTERDANDTHPISSITGLSGELDALNRVLTTSDVINSNQESAVNDPYHDDASTAYTMNDNPYQLGAGGFLFPFPIDARVLRVRTNISNSGWLNEDLVFATVKMPTRTADNPNGTVGDSVTFTDVRTVAPTPTYEGVYIEWDFSDNPIIANAGDYMAVGTGNYAGTDRPVRLQARQWAHFADGERCVCLNFNTAKISYLGNGVGRRFYFGATYIPKDATTLEERLSAIERTIAALQNPASE